MAPWLDRIDRHLDDRGLNDVASRSDLANFSSTSWPGWHDKAAYAVPEVIHGPDLIYLKTLIFIS